MPEGCIRDRSDNSLQMSILPLSVKAAYDDFMSLSANKTPEATPSTLYSQCRTVLPLLCIVDTESPFAIPSRCKSQSCPSCVAEYHLGDYQPYLPMPWFPWKGNLGAHPNQKLRCGATAPPSLQVSTLDDWIIPESTIFYSIS